MFDSAKAKLEWAKKHVRDLEATFNIFVETHRYSLVVDGDPDTGFTVEARFDDQIPSNFAMILGDAIHNMRTALDHAMWELIGLDGGTQDRWTTLPAGIKRIDYEASCKGVKTPRDDTKKFLVGLATYKSGAGQAIYGLHVLDNAEKHTVITPVVQVARAGFRVIRPDGKPMLTVKDSAFGPCADGRMHIGTFGPGLRIEFDQEPKPAVDIFFGNVEMFNFHRVVPTLMHLSDAVSDYIRQFETFVANRTP